MIYYFAEKHSTHNVLKTVYISRSCSFSSKDLDGR